MKRLAIITNNKGKFAEASAIAKEFGVRLVKRGDVGKVELQSDSLKEVAEFAAKEAYRKLRMPLIVDDSGLFIDALGGFPGVYSAQIGSSIGLKGVLKLMRGVKDRSAYFECAVSFYDGKTLKTFVGRTHGKILQKEQGTGLHGFGYDPMFSPDGYQWISLAQVDLLKKNDVSHRGKAFRAFFKWYSNAK